MMTCIEFYEISYSRQKFKFGNAKLTFCLAVTYRSHFLSPLLRVKREYT